MRYLYAKISKVAFSACSGPVRLYDPQLYYRYQAWHAFAAGATGQGFWAFGDTRGAPTSWHDYAITRPSSYAPGFIDRETVYASVHLEALREGVEDYEELAMLGDFIKRTSDEKLRAEAKNLRDTALKTITGLWEPTYRWRDCALAGTGRQPTLQSAGFSREGEVACPFEY